MSDLDLFDLDLSKLETVQDSPSSEGEEQRKERIFQESLKIVQQAMDNVIQEILITLEDGTSHLVYVTKLNWNNGQVELDFATLDSERKAELTPHVEKCIRIQLEEALKTSVKSRKKFKFF